MKFRSDLSATMAVGVARLLLSSIFVLGGLDAFRHPASKVPMAEQLVGPLVRHAPGNASTEQIVRADGAAKVIGGLALATGVLPRLAALGLAASLVPTTLAGHPFWEQTEPGARAAHQAHFFKNAAVLGGLLLVAVSATPARRDTRQ
jgi:putative oxidoreductase